MRQKSAASQTHKLYHLYTGLRFISWEESVNKAAIHLYINTRRFIAKLTCYSAQLYKCAMFPTLHYIDDWHQQLNTLLQMTTVCRTLPPKSRGTHSFRSVLRTSWNFLTRWSCPHELHQNTPVWLWSTFNHRPVTSHGIVWWVACDCAAIDVNSTAAM